MLRSVIASCAAATVVLAAAPLAAAQAPAPFGLEQAKQELAEVAPQGKWSGASEDRLGKWAERVREALATRSVPQLRKWLKDEAVEQLRTPVVKRKRLRSSLVRRDLLLIYVALESKPAIDDALALVGIWQGVAKRAGEIDGEYFQVLAPIADLGPIGRLDHGQRDLFFKQMQWTVKYARHKLHLTIPAIERAGERRYVSLLADDAIRAVESLPTDGPLQRQRIAESLGRWWNFTPELDLRIPALVKLTRYPTKDTVNAAMAGLDRMVLGWSAGTPKQQLKAFQKLRRQHPADGDCLAAIARLRKADEDPTVLAPDIAGRLDDLKRRDSSWATPLFLDVFGWTEAELGIARAGAIKSLALTRDEGAIAALIDLLAGLDSPQQKAEAIEAIGELARTKTGDPARTVVEILRASLRKGDPLPRTAAAAAVGELRLAEAVDELFAYGDDAQFHGQLAAWRALAQIGNAKAEAGLLQRFDDAERADRVPFVHAFGAWHTLPLPDGIAERVGQAWDAGSSGDLFAAAVTAAVHRGLAHPSLQARVLRLIVDGGSPEEIAGNAVTHIATWEEETVARPLLLGVLAAGPSPDREDAALSWLAERPAADLRAPCLAIAGNAERRLEVRLRATRLLGAGGVWDVNAVGPPLIAQLARTSGHDDMARAIRDALLSHPDATLFPAVAALLPARPVADAAAPAASHALLVRHILWDWASRAEGYSKPPPAGADPIRGDWTRWWSGAVKAGVTFR